MRPRAKSSILICTVVAVLTLAALGQLRNLDTNTQDWQNWVEISSESRATYGLYQQLFGSSDFLVISWPGCTEDDPRLSTYVGEIKSLDQQGLIKSYSDGPTVVRQIVESKVEVSAETARKRLKGILFGPDEKQTCLTLELSQAGSTNRRETVDRVLQAADNTEGLDRDLIKLGGNAYVNVALDEEVNRSMILAVPGIILAFLIAWWSLGCLRQTIVALTTSGMAALFSLALVIATGYTANGLTILMPILVLTVTLSSAIHLLGYYSASDKSSVEERLAEMLSLGTKPASFAMITSAIGVGSLAIGKVPAVQQFGTYSFFSILIGLALLIFFLPAFARLLFGTSKSTQTRAATIGPIRLAILALTSNRSLPIVSSFIVALGVTAVGLFWINPKIETEALFLPESRFRQDYQWLEENVIPLEGVQVILKFPKQDQTNWNEQLASTIIIQNQLTKLEMVQYGFSAASVAGRIPGIGRDVETTARRSLFNETIGSRLSDLKDSNLFSETADAWYWRIQLACFAHNENDYNWLSAKCLETVSETQLQVTGTASGYPRPTAFVSGLNVLAYQGGQSVFTDLCKSFMLALIVITLVMVLLLHRIQSSLIAMLPNITPPVILFGTLGLIGYSVDIGMLLTACVGLGIAVDNTFHFLHQYQIQLDRTGRPATSVKKAFVHCSRAILQTTAITCCGLFCFAFAVFVPVRQFAIAIVAILLLALIADIILLPALISLWKGKLFQPANRSASKTP